MAALAVCVGAGVEVLKIVCESYTSDRADQRKQRYRLRIKRKVKYEGGIEVEEELEFEFGSERAMEDMAIRCHAKSNADIQHRRVHD